MGLMWGAGLSDSTDVYPMKEPEHSRRDTTPCRLVGSCLQNWNHLGTKLGTISPTIISAGTCHAQILHSSVLGLQEVANGKFHFKTKSPQVSAGHTESIFTIHNLRSLHPMRPLQVSWGSHSSKVEMTGLGGGSGMRTSRNAWTESKISICWDAPRHHCLYKFNYLELMLAQLLSRNYI